MPSGVLILPKINDNIFKTENNRKRKIISLLVVCLTSEINN